MTPKVLNVGFDEKLIELRTAIIEQAGYEVTAASNLQQVIQSCQQQEFDAVLIGHGIPLNEKKRIVATVREVCGPDTPILALYRLSAAEADGTDRAVDAQHPEELVKVLRELLPPRHLETRARIDS